MAGLCGGCDIPSWVVFGRFHGEIPGNAENALQFLRDHGVLPRCVWCPRCKLPCHLRKDSPRWYCSSYKVVRHTKKRLRCNFSVSDYKGTFFERAHVEPWKVVLFVNHWLRKHWDHAEVVNNLRFSSETSVQWRRNCSLVTETWLERQEAIGGRGVVVEVDRKLFCKRKFKRGRPVSQIWVLGGIERESKCAFIVPLIDKVGRDAIVPQVTKYVRPGSVVVCGQWGASLSLHKLGYTFITAQADEEEESDSATPKAEVEGEEPDYTTATPRTDFATPATPAEEEKETQTHLEPRECTTTRASNFEKTSHATPTRQKTHTLPVTQIAEDSDEHSTHTTADTSPAAARHPPAHTETIRDLWKDLKDWVRRPGMRLDYFQEYLSRFLFIRHHKDQHLHRFFIETARLFPPHADLSAPTDTPADTPADTHQGMHKGRYAEKVEFGETSD